MLLAPITKTGTATSCAHCGLPVPRGLRRAAPEPSFCCNACETAFGMIHACGMADFYAIASDSKALGRPAAGAGRRYEELEASADIVRIDPRRWTTRLTITGLHCAACLWLLERLPRMHAGVIESRVNMARATICLAWDPELTSLAAIARRIDALGYAVAPHEDNLSRADRRSPEARHALVRIGVAGAIAGNVMLASVALYAGESFGIEPVFEQMFRWMCLGLSILLLAWPGATFFRGALAAIRSRTPHMDLPVSIGLLVGGVAGAWSTVRGSGDIYFDSLSALVFLLLIGRWLQASQHERAFDAVATASSLSPRTARVMRPDGAMETPIQLVQAGDHVEVLAGETIPVDGVISDGRSSLDRSIMTGESLPVSVEPGDPACAGEVNVASRLVLRVERAGSATRLAAVMRLVEEAMDRRAPIELLANRVAGVFVVVVLAVAAATFLLWAPFELSRAVACSTALLIVTCPCALGLATPLTVAIGLGRAARAGIFIKGGAALERLATPGDIVLDKTGTLTLGRCVVTEWTGEESLKPLVAAAESACDHPTARALASIVPRADIPVQVRHIAGGGLIAELGGDVLAIGSEPFVRQSGSKAPLMRLAAAIERAVTRGESPVLIARNGRIEAVASIGDVLRTEAPAVVRSLESRSWTTHILSGDRQEVVDAVADRLGVDRSRAHGSVSPEGKAAFIREKAARGRVVMVGDGVNDAAALAEAGVGVAIRGGAEASLAAADVFLIEPDLSLLLRTIDGARRVVGTIRLTIAISLAYNVVCAGLAVTGLISPLGAAVLMPVSSLTVLAIAQRRRSF